MKQKFSLMYVIAAMAFCAQMLFAQQVKMEPSYFGAPVTCYDKLNVSSGKLMLDGVALVTTNTFGGNLTVGNLTVDTNLVIQGTSLAGGAVTLVSTLTVTGQVAMVVAPKMTVVTAAAATTLTLTNGPSVTAAASPVYINVVIGTTTYVVPAWAKP